MKNGRFSRREILRALSLSATGSAALPLWLSSCREQLNTPASLETVGRRRDALDGKPKFLIVISASGGGSIVDSFMAVRASECGNAATLNTFPDAQVQTVNGSPFRAVKYSSAALGLIPQAVNTDQLAFVTKHQQNMLVATTVGTSVNHAIAQKRSLTGNAAWRGRTLQECVALQFGANMPMPNVNMAGGRYTERGTDDSLPAYCYGETVQSPALWPLGLDGRKGIKDAPAASVLQAARAARQELEEQSVFSRTFEGSKVLQRWRENRQQNLPKLEAADLITKLNVLPDMPPSIPLTEFGLNGSPEGDRLRTAFPKYFTDPFEGQAALAFLLMKYRVSTAITLGPNFNATVAQRPDIVTNPPLAFDYSHNDHRGAQAFMWARILGVVDRLVDLLKSEPFDATSGETLWDRSLIYIATDFGRTRNRVANQTTFGSGHDLNNGVVMLSPMVKGNTILGGIDAQTTLTHGFDARTGAPEIGKVSSNEPDIFSGILTSMGLDLSGSGLPDASAFKKV
jgi:hypothetical protein